MITIPLYILAIIFFIYLFVSLIFVLINYGHIIKTASLGLFSTFFSTLIIAGIIIVLWYTYMLLLDTNWSNNITLFDTNWFGAIFQL